MEGFRETPQNSILDEQGEVLGETQVEDARYGGGREEQKDNPFVLDVETFKAMSPEESWALAGRLVEAMGEDERREIQPVLEDVGFVASVAGNESVSREVRKHAAGQTLGSAFAWGEDIGEMEEDAATREQTLEAQEIVAETEGERSFWEKHPKFQKTLLGVATLAGFAGMLGKSSEAQAEGWNVDIGQIVKVAPVVLGAMGGGNRHSGIQEGINMGNRAIRYEQEQSRYDARERSLQIERQRLLTELEQMRNPKSFGASERSDVANYELQRARLEAQREQATAHYNSIANPTDLEEAQYRAQTAKIDAAQEKLANSFQPGRKGGEQTYRDARRESNVVSRLEHIDAQLQKMQLDRAQSGVNLGRDVSRRW